MASNNAVSLFNRFIIRFKFNSNQTFTKDQPKTLALNSETGIIITDIDGINQNEYFKSSIYMDNRGIIFPSSYLFYINTNTFVMDTVDINNGSQHGPLGYLSSIKSIQVYPFVSTGDFIQTDIWLLY